MDDAQNKENEGAANGEQPYTNIKSDIGKHRGDQRE